MINPTRHWRCPKCGRSFPQTLRSIPDAEAAKIQAQQIYQNHVDACKGKRRPRAKR